MPKRACDRQARGARSPLAPAARLTQGLGSAQVRLGALVAGACDVCGASPRRYFFEVLRHFATEEHETERLQYFSSPEGRDDLYRYNQREGAR